MSAGKRLRENSVITADVNLLIRGVVLSDDSRHAFGLRRRYPIGHVAMAGKNIVD